MEAVTFKCPDCGGTLIFDNETGRMFCEHCAQYFPMEFFKKEQSEAAGSSNGQNPEVSYVRGDLGAAEVGGEWEQMKVHIYHCQSCGAEVMTGEDEVSKFCSFCGNPTIMFDRIDEENKPNRIIPFKLSKEEALERVKKRFANAILLECDVDDFQIDTVYPIYMPYWVFQTKYGMAMTTRVKRENGAPAEENDGIIENRTVPMDASSRLDDNIAQILGPFHFEESKVFVPTYLSGYYADRGDVDRDTCENNLQHYLRKQAQAVIRKRSVICPPVLVETYRDKGIDVDSMVSYQISDESLEIMRRDYMLLPVYFLTMRVDNLPINILVNGQTGKVVGNIPISEEKLKMRQRRDMIVFGIIGACFGLYILNLLLFLFGLLVVAVPAVIFVIETKGRKWERRFYTRYRQTNSQKMFRISERRK